MSATSGARGEAATPSRKHAGDRDLPRVALCWGLLALIWFGPLGSRALLSPDEGRYATIALEMLRSGDWITPRLNGFLYFEKPPLQYWMGATSLWLFGINEFAARFWPALTGFLSIAAVAFTAHRLWGRDAGRYAAMAMAGTVWVIANAHFLSLDMGLCFFLTLTLCGFLLAQHGDTSARAQDRAMWIAWAAMAGATLSKGLVGVLIPGAVLVLYSLVDRRWAFWRRMRWRSGLVLFLVLAAPWFIAVAQRNPDFLEFFFIREHFQRYLTEEARRTGPLWYFVPYLLAGFLPWTSLLPMLASTGAEREAGGGVRAQRLLLVWAVFVFMFFSLSGSKLPSYILPMFPALALLLAPRLARIDAARLVRHLLLPGASGVALLVLAALAPRFVTVNTPAEALQALAIALAMAGILVVFSTLLAWRALRRQAKPLAVLLLAAGALLAVTITMSGHARLGALKNSKAVAIALNQQLAPGSEVFSVAMYDQTLPFYLRRNVTLVQYTDEFAFGQAHDPQRWIPTIEQFAARWRALRQAGAMMQPDTFAHLQRAGLPMRVVYRDPRRLVVTKP